MIFEIQQLIEKNRAVIRRFTGTVLKNKATGEVMYTPPSGERQILALMGNFEKYINDDYDNIDLLIK